MRCRWALLCLPTLAFACGVTVQDEAIVPTSQRDDASSGVAPDASADSPAPPINADGGDESSDGGVPNSDAAPLTLAPLRVEVPCGKSVSGSYCETGATTKQDVRTIPGAIGTSYDVTVRVRGVVEQKTYTGATAGGATGPLGANLFALGGTPDTGHWNNYSLTVSDPPAVYRLNKGSSGNDYCDALDYSATLLVNAGATLMLEGISVDPNSAKNRRDDGSAIVVPDIPPAPAAFNGQFAQVDFVTITPK